MANRYLNQFSYSFERMPVTVCAQTLGGASITLQAWQPNTQTYATASTGGFHGVKSVTHNSTGDFTFKFQDNYLRFLGFGMSILATTTTPTALAAYVKDGGLNLTASGGATIEVITCLGSATAAEIPAANVAYWEFYFSNSNAL